MAAWGPTGELARGTYAWRVRGLDADSKPGPWSPGWRFTLATNPTSTSLQVVKLARKVQASGSLNPAHPGRIMTVTLMKKSGVKFVRVAQVSATLSASSNYVATFARPSKEDARYWRASLAIQTICRARKLSASAASPA